VDKLTGARLVVRQVVRRADQVLFDALVTIVAIGAAGKPARLPAAIRRN
jgi:acyl-CoA thioester hydrolase